jgi:CheY-like chemotaxis protein
MVHGVATQSGGGLQFDSSVGRGTTVRVYLPRARWAAAEPKESENRSCRARDRATILVVDDDAAVREVAVSSLETFGYRVLAAENGPAALDVLERAERVDLLLVDMAMPGISGVELISRARERRLGLRAMLVTGYADITAFSPAEGDLVLQKPYRLERLASSVAEALRRDVPKTTSNVVAMKPSRRALTSD